MHIGVHTAIGNLGRHLCFEDLFHHALDLLPCPFSKVLIFVVRFGLVILDLQNVKDSANVGTDFCLGRVADELVHGSVSADFVHQNGSKFLVRGTQAVGR